MFNCSLVEQLMCKVLAVCYFGVAVEQHYCDNQESIIIIAWGERSKARKALEALSQQPFSSCDVIVVELDPFLTE